MAANNNEAIMALLSLLGVGKNNQPKAWQTYGSINDKGPSTLVLQARGQVTNIVSSLLGPTFGPLVGSIASDYIVGLDFTKSGGLQNALSGLLSASSGTYANAFQRTYQRQTLSMLTPNRLKILKELSQDFYKNYYDLTMEGVSPTGKYKTKAAREKAILAQTKAAMNNVVSVPAALLFLIDPALNKRAMRGIKDTQAGLLYWQSRMDPLAALGLGKRDPNLAQQMSELLGNRMKGMITLANAWNLGKGKGGLLNSYGGFNGASVAELASILQNSANQLDIRGVEGLRNSLKAFLEKVRQTSRALAPLKDIFGLDIKAMTDMIQATTGQNITQLTPSMINSIAKNTSDMARYSGATIAQIANAGQKLFIQSAEMGGTTFSRIGASRAGAFYTGLIAQGNAPAGVHAALYAGNTQKAVASAQASAGADRAAMAYGLWRLQQILAGKNGKDDISVLTFMTEVQAHRRNSDTMMQALAKTAGTTLHGLIKGVLTSGYREALQSGYMAQLGVSLQYQNKLGRAILGLRMSGMRDVSDQSLVQLGAFMSDLSNAAVIKDLLTNSNDSAAVERFLTATQDKKYGGRYSAITKQAVNYLLNRGLVVQLGARWASISLMNNFIASQLTLRKLLLPLEAQGTGAYLTFWRALNSSPDKLTTLLSDKNTEGLTISGEKDGKSATISKKAIMMHTRALLGTTDIESTKNALMAVRTAFGGDRADQVLALASGDLAKDDKFIRSLRLVAKNKQGTAEYTAAKAYILARRSKHISGKTSIESFENSKLAKDLYVTASDKYIKDMADAAKIKDSAARLAKLKLVGDAYYTQILNAYRLRNILKATFLDLGKDLGIKSEKDWAGKGGKQEQIKALIKSGKLSIYASMSEADFGKLKGKDAEAVKGLSLLQLRTALRVTASGYDRKTDYLRLVSTVMTAIRNFLKKLADEGIKVKK